MRWTVWLQLQQLYTQASRLPDSLGLCIASLSVPMQWKSTHPAALSRRSSRRRWGPALPAHPLMLSLAGRRARLAHPLPRYSPAAAAME